MDGARQSVTRPAVVIFGVLVGVVVGAIIGYFLGNVIVVAAILGVVAFYVTALHSPAELKTDPRTRGINRSGF